MKGYIAITTILIILAIVTLIILTLSSSSIFEASSGLDYSLSQESYYLALACSEYSLFQLVNNPPQCVGGDNCSTIYNKTDCQSEPGCSWSGGYSGNEVLNFLNGSCTINSISDTGTQQRTIQTKGQVKDYVKKIEVRIDRVFPEIIVKSIKEIP